MNEPFRTLLEDDAARTYVIDTLTVTLASVGFSRRAVYNIIDKVIFACDDAPNGLPDEEMRASYDDFLTYTAPDFLARHILPHLDGEGPIADLGCGQGILSRRIASAFPTRPCTGIDIASYAEWRLSTPSNLRFVRGEVEQVYPLTKAKLAVLTWSLHHMSRETQSRYVQLMASTRTERVVIMEDSYSTEMSPRDGPSIYQTFMSLSRESRQSAMSILDCLANKILAGRTTTPLPYSYRTAEEWIALFGANGYTSTFSSFLGFPPNRDIATPQTLLVFELQYDSQRHRTPAIP